MTIKINNQEYRIKQTIRALFLFEEITGKGFKLETTLDNYLYFYCLLLANNEGFMGWDEFIDALDSDPSILSSIYSFIEKQQAMDKLLDTEEADKDGKKKD